MEVLGSRQATLASRLGMQDFSCHSSRLTEDLLAPGILLRIMPCGKPAPLKGSRLLLMFLAARVKSLSHCTKTAPACISLRAVQAAVRLKLHMPGLEHASFMKELEPRSVVF